MIEDEHREGWIEAPPTEATRALLKDPPRELDKRAEDELAFPT